MGAPSPLCPYQVWRLGSLSASPVLSWSQHRAPCISRPGPPLPVHSLFWSLTHSRPSSGRKQVPSQVSHPAGHSCSNQPWGPWWAPDLLRTCTASSAVPLSEGGGAPNVLPSPPPLGWDWRLTSPKNVLGRQEGGLPGGGNSGLSLLSQHAQLGGGRLGVQRSQFSTQRYHTGTSPVVQW